MDLGKQRMNRREFASLAALLSFAPASFFGGCARSTRIYESGDTIETPAGKVRINGWNLDFADKDMKTGPDQYMEFRTTNIKGRADFQVMKHPHLFHANNADELLDTESKTYRVTLFPFRENKHLPIQTATLELLVRDKISNVLDSFQYGIRVKAFTDPDTYDLGVYSEEPLPQSTLHALEQLRSAFKDRFNMYTMDDIYLVNASYDTKEGKVHHRVAKRDDENKRAVISTNSFTHPQYENEGLILAFHELSHGIVDKTRKLLDQSYSVALWNAYVSCSKAAGYKGPIFEHLESISEGENNKMFRLFDESAYAREIVHDPIRTIGHPYENSNELFASGLTVFKFFGKEFLDRYNKLNGSQKSAAKETGKAIFRIIEQQVNIQHDTQRKLNDLQSVIPMYSRLRIAFYQ